MTIRRVGVLTGGGDAPGLNPALKAAVYKATGLGMEVIGLYDGWKGLLGEGCQEALKLEDHMVRKWDRDGGTHLGSSRTNPFRLPPSGEGEVRDCSDKVLKNMEKLGLDAVIALGGEDALGVAEKLYCKGARIVGIPKTIDNGLSGTGYTLGFDTALRNCTACTPRLGGQPSLGMLVVGNALRGSCSPNVQAYPHMRERPVVGGIGQIEPSTQPDSVPHGNFHMGNCPGGAILPRHGVLRESAAAFPPIAATQASGGPRRPRTEGRFFQQGA